VSDDLAVPGSNLPAEPEKKQLPAEPSAAGIIPDVPIMRKQTYASPMSYVGITRRSTAWVRRVGDTQWKTGLAVIAVALFLAVMYVLLLGWYFVIFVLFGVFTFPYRLVRRSHRKQEHMQKQQLATMQAMLIQQQQTLNQTKDE
jgi:Flp pilus assembly protein TadB